MSLMVRKIPLIIFCLFLGALGNHIFSREGSLKERIFSKPWSEKETKDTTSVVSVDQSKANREAAKVVVNKLTGAGKDVRASKMPIENSETIGLVAQVCEADDYLQPVSSSENPLVGLWKVTTYECPLGGLRELYSRNAEMKNMTASSYWRITANHVVIKSTYKSGVDCMVCSYAEFKKISESALEMTYRNRVHMCVAADPRQDRPELFNKPMNLPYKMYGNKLEIEFPKKEHSLTFAQWCLGEGPLVVHLERN